MSHFTDELWESFSAESEECLDKAGALLEKAESGADGGMVSEISKQFNVLGELADVLGLETIERVAAGCGRLLFTHEKISAPIDPVEVRLLTEGRQALSDLVQRAIQTREDSGSDHELLPRIENAIEGTIRASGTDLPDENRELGRLAGDRLALYPDQDLGLLMFFGDTVREHAPVIVRVLAPDFGGSNRSGVDASFDSLIAAAQDTDLPFAAKALGDLKKLVPQDGPLHSKQKAAFIELMALFKSVIDLIETRLDIDAGSAAFPGELQNYILRDFHNLLDIAGSELYWLNQRSGETMNVTGKAALLSDFFRKAHMFLLLLIPNVALQRMILSFQDVYSRMAKEEIGFFEKLPPLSIDAIGLARDIASGGGLSVENRIADLEKELAGRLKLAINEKLGIDLDESKQRLENIGINREYLDTMAPELVKELLDALDHGKRAYELTAKMESNETFSEKFIGWLNENATTVTEKNVGGSDSLDFLLVSSLDPVEIKAAFAALDPENIYLEFKKSFEL